MAAAFKFELVSPERLLMSQDVDAVVVPGSEGIFTVLKDHAPFMTTMRPGVVQVTTGATTSRVFVRGGFADVNASGLTILAEKAIPVDEIKGDVIAGEIASAREDVADAKTDEGRRVAEQTLNQLLEVQTALASGAGAH